MGLLPRLTRRRFLASVLAGSASVGLYAWRIEPHWVELVERDLAIANLPDALIGQVLIQISDLHVGPAVDADYLITTLQWVSALRPAITVVTGDFMTCNGGEQIEAVSQVMKYLVPGKLGCIAIMGNHDYGLGWSDSVVADNLVNRLDGMGIQFLRNECQMVGGMQIVGLEDMWGPNFQPEATLAAVDWQRATLTLCHNPDAVDLPALSVCRGWILAGHTHGGQCKPPFLPPPVLPVRNTRYTSGEFDVGNGRRLYINRGLGHLLRVRFNVRPEISAFRMIRA
jgi:uncharacterized protein